MTDSYLTPRDNDLICLDCGLSVGIFKRFPKILIGRYVWDHFCEVIPGSLAWEYFDICYGVITINIKAEGKPRRRIFCFCLG